MGLIRVALAQLNLRVGDFDSNVERVAQMRLELDAMRFVVHNAAETIDIYGPKAARRAIAQCKILVPTKIEKIVNECMQVFGGQGVTQHTPLPVSFLHGVKYDC